MDTKMKLSEHQIKALNKMHNGCILCGDTGSGKSRTALAYYEKNHRDKTLVVITTALKRDTMDWQKEAIPLLLNNMIVDSWNNVAKYVDYKDDYFFIFDEQRVVGYGTWAKSFIKITGNNPWILLSATPGDCWSDYLPVFIANGYFRNKTEFENLHVIYDRYCKYKKHYINTRRLEVMKDQVLVSMGKMTETVQHDIYVHCEYDFMEYRRINKTRTKWQSLEPIINASQLCYELRKCCNSDETRRDEVKKIVDKHERVIIFYNFDYELDILKSIDFGEDVVTAEWNGHIHDECPKWFKWVYFVQYAAGCEGWNCISTNAMIFYSQTYSYKALHQAKGRIDRMNTPFTDLYYYHFISDAKIELAIKRALKSKKNFNAGNFINWNAPKDS